MKLFALNQELEMILSEVKPKWIGKLRSLFIVLSDDMIPRKARGRTSAPKSKSTEQNPKESGSGETSGSGSGGSSGSGRQSHKRDHSNESSKSSKSSKHHKK